MARIAKADVNRALEHVAKSLVTAGGADGRVSADAAPEAALADPDVRRYVVGGELHRVAAGAARA